MRGLKPKSRQSALVRRSISSATRLIEILASLTVIFAWPHDGLAAGDPLAAHSLTLASDKPVVAILLSNKMTEATDFLAPYHILSRSGAFNVLAVAPRNGRAPLLWGISTKPQMDFQTLDERVGGADIVIVPAIADFRKPAILDWLRGQAAQGAIIMSICEGARVVAAAGLFDGKTATSHFFAIKGLAKKYPSVNWVRGKRYIEDGDVISTAGVTAAIDASLMLVEKQAGASAARSVAKAIRYNRDYAPEDYDTPKFGLEDLMPLIGGLAGMTRPTKIAIQLEDDFDELSLAAFADIFPRTLSLRAVFKAADNQPVTSRYGLVFTGARKRRGKFAGAVDLDCWTRSGSGFSYDRVLNLIADETGYDRARFVAKQLEYPGWFH